MITVKKEWCNYYNMYWYYIYQGEDCVCSYRFKWFAIRHAKKLAKWGSEHPSKIILKIPINLEDK